MPAITKLKGCIALFVLAGAGMFLVDCEIILGVKTACANTTAVDDNISLQAELTLAQQKLKSKTSELQRLRSKLKKNVENTLQAKSAQVEQLRGQQKEQHDKHMNLLQAKQQLQSQSEELQELKAQLKAAQINQQLAAASPSTTSNNNNQAAQEAAKIPDALSHIRDRPANKNVDLAYIAPGGQVAISFSTCAKCGSTSLYYSLYEAIYGKQWSRVGRPWVHHWNQWPKDGRPKGSKLVYAGFLENTTIAWQHYHIYRDPVERYISAYLSKVRCCQPELPGATVAAVQQGQRQVCAADGSDSMFTTKSILANSKTSYHPLGYHPETAACLYFEEYTHLLKTAKSPSRLDNHIKPQTMPKSKGNARLEWTGTIAELGRAVQGLTQYGFSEIQVRKDHVTKASSKGNWTASPAGMANLCALAVPEYQRFGIPPNPLCRPSKTSSSSSSTTKQ